MSSWSWDANTASKDSYDEFVRFLRDQWPWDNQEGVVLSRWSSYKKSFLLVQSDQNVVNMFADNEKSKPCKKYKKQKAPSCNKHKKQKEVAMLKKSDIFCAYDVCSPLFCELGSMHVR
jgi:hypothetical protein